MIECYFWSKLTPESKVLIPILKMKALVYIFKEFTNLRLRGKNEHMCLQKPSVINAWIHEAPSTSVSTNMALLEPIYHSSRATYTLGLLTWFLPFNASSSQEEMQSASRIWLSSWMLHLCMTFLMSSDDTCMVSSRVFPQILQVLSKLLEYVIIYIDANISKQSPHHRIRLCQPNGMEFRETPLCSYNHCSFA